MAGSLELQRVVLDELDEHGNAFWHFILKAAFVRKANDNFLRLDVHIIEDHWNDLGSSIRADENCNHFMDEKSMNYSSVLSKLA